MWKPTPFLIALAVLVGCSREPAPAPAAQASAPSSAAIQAELARFQAEGIEPLARQLAMGDYFLHYHLMQSAEMFEEMGDEEQAVAALIAVGEAHERHVRWGKDVEPRMVPAQFGGEGMQAGMYGFGAASFVGVLVEQLVRESGFESQLEAHIEALSDPSVPKPEVGQHLDGVEVQVAEDGHYVDRVTNVDKNRDIHSKDYGEPTGDMTTTTTEMDSNGLRSTTERIVQGKTTEKATVGMDRDGAVMFESTVNEKGLQGKISVRIRMDKCPDPQGKVTVNMTVNSRICVAGKPGSCGNVHADFEFERYLDDDAHLAEVSDRDRSDMRLIMGAKEGGKRVGLDVTMGQKDGTPTFTENKTEGLSIFRPSEVKSAEKSIAQIYNYMAMLAEMMLRGMGKKAPWESGRCVEVEVKTDPEKRTGADPETKYKITVIPRSKSDGQVTTGTVQATLSGDSSLDPANTKVKVEADVKFDYLNPKEKDKKANIAFEARSKRGVGRATANFDTENKNSYRIESAVCEGGGTETMDVCDVTKPFSVTFCGGTSTVRHTPSGEKGGTFAFRYTSQYGHAENTGTYTLSGEKEQLTATYANNPVCFTVQGKTMCQPAPSNSVTWTKIDDCED